MAASPRLSSRVDTNVEAIELTADLNKTRDSLWRMGSWAMMTLIITALAVVLARTESGQRNVNNAFDFLRPAKAPAPTVASVDPMHLYETRRLAEQVRLLSAERDMLAERLDSVERTVGDVTASISRERKVKPAEPVAVPPPPAVVTQEPQPQDTLPAKGEFGVDLANGETSIEALKQKWSQMRSQHSALLEGLKPLVSIVDGTKPGYVELRLVAGPLSNSNIAARLCASLASAGAACKPASYDGQRLSLP